MVPMKDNKGRFLVVSNRLPVTMTSNDNKWEAKSSSGGLVNALDPVLKNRGGFWVGWPGTCEEVKMSVLKEILGPISKKNGYRFMPVLLTKKDIEEYYHGFSNSVLWPLFHDFQSRCDFLPEYWEGYDISEQTKNLPKSFTDMPRKTILSGSTTISLFRWDLCF